MNQIARETALPAIYNPNTSTIVYQDEKGQEQTIYLKGNRHGINNGDMFRGYLDLNHGASFAVKGIFATQYDANNAHHDVDNEIIIRNHILKQERDIFQVAADHRVIIPRHLLCNSTQDNIPNDQKYYFILSSWADGGDLCDSFVNPFDENHCRNKFRQMFEIVNYLHGRGVFHRDLKPENFVLHGEDRGVYVIDFGKSRICDTELIQNDNRRYGTTLYTPPELNGDPTPSIDWKKADIWALGVSLYLMLTGQRPPWNEDNNGRVVVVRRENPWFQYICRNRKFAELQFEGGTLSGEVTDLLQNMLLEDAADRISIADILRHDWFSNS